MHERVVAYDEPGRTLSYQADKLPWFLRDGRNRWRVEEIDDDRSRVTFEGTIEARGMAGRLLELVLRAQVARQQRESIP